MDPPTVEGWNQESLNEALGLLDQLDRLRADRPVVYLDVVRGEFLIDRLTKLFRLPSHPPVRSMPEAILARRPPLLSTLLWTGECFHGFDEWRRSWMVGTNVLQAQLVTPCENDSLLPIHVACRCAKDHTIIAMANLRPDLLQRRDANGMLPFDHALKNFRHPPSFAVWKALLELYPQAHEHAFGRPMREGGDFMDNFVHWFPKSETTLVITEPSSTAEAFNAHKTRALCRLFPQLQTLHIHYMPGWTTDAFLYFLKEIQNQSSIAHLKSFLLPKLNADEQIPAIQSAFQQALEKNRSIKKLELETREEIEHLSAILPWLRAIRTAVPNKQNNRLDDIIFSIIRQPEQPQLRHNQRNAFFARRINQHQVQGPRAVLLEATIPASNTKIDIQLKGHNPRSDEFWNAIQEFSKLFTVHSLCVRFYDFQPEDLVQCTGNLAATIRTIGFNLKKLQIRGLQVHVPTIIDSLTSNPQLQELQISAGNGRTQDSERTSQLAYAPNVAALLELLKHNVTLSNCPGWFDKDPRIQYYLDLNRLGRRHVRNYVLSKCKLVELLQAVSIDMFEAHPARRRPLARHNTVYGLLREAPGLWCHGNGVLDGSATSCTARRNTKRKGPPL